MPEPPDLRALIDRLPVAIYRTSKDGELLAANEALVGMFGYDSIEEMRDHLTTVSDVYVDAADRDEWLAKMEAEGVVYESDVRMRRADGRTIWVRDTARAITNGSGEVMYYEGALIDVTEKVRAEEARDQFIAAVSHELRNPIAVVLGIGHELADSYEKFGDEERREMARMIAGQADEASWIIEDMLVAHRGDLDSVTVVPKTFRVDEEARAVIQVADADVELKAAEEVWVEADPRRFRQILRNLLSNALRYGGPEVVVEVEEMPDRVEVAVCDSGEPLEPEEIERIFEPFETGTRRQNPNSVGLGLTVSRVLAERMGGRIRYDHDGEFSRFTLILPAA